MSQGDQKKNTDFQYLSTMHFRMQVRLKKNCGQRIFPACHHGHSFGHSIAQCYLPIDKSLHKMILWKIILVLS